MKNKRHQENLKLIPEAPVSAPEALATVKKFKKLRERIAAKSGEDESNNGKTSSSQESSCFLVADSTSFPFVFCEWRLKILRTICLKWGEGGEKRRKDLAG